jgi:hypothetical protein
MVVCAEVSSRTGNPDSWRVLSASGCRLAKSLLYYKILDSRDKSHQYHPGKYDGWAYPRIEALCYTSARELLMRWTGEYYSNPSMSRNY